MLPAERIDFTFGFFPQGPDQRVVPVEDSDSIFVLGKDKSFLRRKIILEGAMPVEMILGNVEKSGYGYSEAVDIFKLEAGNFGDIDMVILAIFGKSDEWRADVTGQEGFLSGLFQNFVGQCRRGGFSIGSGNPDNLSPKKVVSQLDLRKDGDAFFRRYPKLGEGRCTRAGDDQVGLEKSGQAMLAGFEANTFLPPSSGP